MQLIKLQIDMNDELFISLLRIAYGFKLQNQDHKDYLIENGLINLVADGRYIVTKSGKNFIKENSNYKHNIFTKTNDYDALKEIPANAFNAMFTVMLKYNIIQAKITKNNLNRLVSDIINSNLYDMLDYKTLKEVNEKTFKTIRSKRKPKS